MFNVITGVGNGVWGLIMGWRRVDWVGLFCVGRAMTGRDVIFASIPC